MLKVGIIGCGYWGPNLIRNFSAHEATAAVMVADKRPQRLQAVERSYPRLKTTTDAAELIANPDIDLVAVATPVSSHLELAKAALEAGKHVLLEKPLASTAAQARSLCDLADERGLKLFVDHTFLFTPAVKKLKSLVDNGELGEVLYVHSVRMNLGLYQEDVSVIWDIAPHDLSILQYLLGRPPDEVSAVAAAHVSKNDRLYDVAYVSLRYGKTIAHLTLSWLSPVKVRQMTVGGNKKMAVFDDLDNVMKVQIYDCGATPVPERGGESDEIVKVQWHYRHGDIYVPVLDNTEALRAEVGYIVDCIERDVADPINSGRRGLDVVMCLEAADRSAACRGMFVPIEEEP
jgi:predicted dehydrogenase